jgi:hypothetical protein
MLLPLSLTKVYSKPFDLILSGGLNSTEGAKVRLAVCKLRNLAPIWC